MLFGPFLAGPLVQVLVVGPQVVGEPQGSDEPVVEGLEVLLVVPVAVVQVLEQLLSHPGVAAVVVNAARERDRALNVVDDQEDDRLEVVSVDVGGDTVDGDVVERWKVGG